MSQLLPIVVLWIVQVVFIGVQIWKALSFQLSFRGAFEIDYAAEACEVMSDWESQLGKPAHLAV